MNDQTAFDLDRAIQNWREELKKSPAFRDENLNEMESHLRDSIAKLQERGLSTEEAFIIASRRIGGAPALETEFGKVNTGEVWLNRVFWMLAGLMLWALLNSFSSFMARGAVLILSECGYGFLFTGNELWMGNPVMAALFALVHMAIVAGVCAWCWRRITKTGRLSFPSLAKRVRETPVALSVLLFTFLLLGAKFLAVTETALFARYLTPAQFGILARSQSAALLALFFLYTPASLAMFFLLIRRRKALT